MITLFILLIRNNWIYVAEILYSVQISWVTTTFLVSYYLLVSFTCTALILGLISRLIILYFEKDFNKLQIIDKNDRYRLVEDESINSENEEELE